MAWREDKKYEIFEKYLWIQAKYHQCFIGGESSKLDVYN